MGIVVRKIRNILGRSGLGIAKRTRQESSWQVAYLELYCPCGVQCGYGTPQLEPVWRVLVQGASPSSRWVQAAPNTKDLESRNGGFVGNP